ncbi:MAG: phospho-N-acetylmuramoyl-pentapeptide-transferase [Clostridiaceae bacterium]|nr:phospho-N-acetylmuramoyl-pentapeptide-transferase [Clostridiaceae bacterium]
MIFELLAVAIGMTVLTVICGRAGLPLLHKLNVGQRVRDDGPESHFKKSGTPTFGGLFFLLPLVLLAIIALILDRRLGNLVVLILLMLLFALVGFLDDYIKVRISKKGLSMGQKTLLLGVFSILFTVYYLYFSQEEPFLLVPFSGRQLLIAGWVKIPFGLLVVLYLFFISNAVNLTDGVDGLASSVTAVSSAALAGAALLLQSSLNQARPAGWLAAAMFGGCLGFLVFNRYPAKVFMGDTGSQALGAGVAGIALLLGIPWILLSVGIVYIAEAFSVMIQVAYFKKTGGKRIFRMSPIHHHYELGGWSENKIVLVFSLVGLAGGLIGLLVL